MRKTFVERIQAGEVLVADGATGTNLQLRGLPAGVTGEHWVLEHPDQILRLHKDFIAAGSDIILTCTFGASRVHLAHLEMADQTEAINRQAAALARRAVEGTNALVAGSIGPTGEMLKPFGPMEPEAAQETFAEQARLLVESGVDLLVIETQFDIGEATAAVKGARSVTALPIVCSFSYDRGTKTMMGVSPAKMAKAINDLGVQVLGINCGRSLEENLKALQELRASTSLPIWFKPNAGLPATDNMGNLYYELTPEQMGSHVAEWKTNGAQIVGGCCGTSPEHLAQIAKAAK